MSLKSIYQDTQGTSLGYRSAFFVGECYFKLGDYNNAKRMHLEVLRQNPNSHLSYSMLQTIIKCYEREGEKEKEVFTRGG